jgi:pyruvate dehydrogenase E2 component (dihydrolipoamide acetyltransferase)
MPITITMPALSPTMTEGTLARWLKKEGDLIKAGQVIAEIETDKATMEVEAVDEGKLVKLLVPAGTAGVAVNAPIALLAEDGEDAAAVGAAPVASSVHTVTATASSTPIAEEPAAMSQSVRSQVASTASGRIFASPLARRIAEQDGIDLTRVTGTGPHGRIVKADLSAAHQHAANQTGASPAPRAAVAPAPSPKATAPAAAAAGIDARDLADKLGQTYDAIPNSGVRKVIAKRLLESKQTVPHFYLTVDCRLDELMALRAKMNGVEGLKLSVNDFIIRAVALGLKKVPAANAAWTEDAILQFKQVDVSVAVATPNGLITPIVKQADQKTVALISKEMKELAQRAKDGKLKPEEFMGGGFSISNLGMFGVKDFAAIINPPQACILAVGAGEQRPVVIDGALAVATVMSCTLSVDHRAVDGAVGAEFLKAFKQLIEQPYGLVV